MTNYSPEHLFRLNSKEDVFKWITKLKYFIFERAFGGHANDGDELTTAITYSTIKELTELSRKLGISLDSLDKQHEELISSNQLTSSLFLGHQIINNSRWGIHLSNKAIILSALNSSPYCISNTDFEACKGFESYIVKYQLENLVPVDLLKERPRAITIERYSEYFK